MCPSSIRRKKTLKVDASRGIPLRILCTEGRTGRHDVVCAESEPDVVVDGKGQGSEQSKGDAPWTRRGRAVDTAVVPLVARPVGAGGTDCDAK